MEGKMERKKQVIRLSNYSLEIIHDLVSNTPPENLEKTGLVDHWSIKDHMAHLAHWLTRFNRRFIERARNIKQITDGDKANAEVWESNKDVAWDKVLNKLEKAYSANIQHTRLLSEDDLVSTEMLFPPEERPLWNSIIGSTCIHTITHLSLIYNDQDKRDKSIEIFEKIFEDMQALDPTPRWRALNIYNLACLYSLSKNQPKAVDLLKESFSLRPDLRDLSQKDTDLDPIRKNPAFLALFEAN